MDTKKKRTALYHLSGSSLNSPSEESANHASLSKSRKLPAIVNTSQSTDTFQPSFRETLKGLIDLTDCSRLKRILGQIAQAEHLGNPSSTMQAACEMSVGSQKINVRVKFTSDFEDEKAGVAFDAFGVEIKALLGQNPESVFMRTVIANLVAHRLNELGEVLFLPFDSPEMCLVQVMERCICKSDLDAIKQQASSLVPLLQECSNGLQEDVTKQFSAFSEAIINAFSSGAENHGFEVMLEEQKRHDVCFLRNLSSLDPDFKGVRDLDPGLFWKLNPKARQYMKYPFSINVARLAKALYFRRCASLLLSSGNQRLTLWPEQKDSEEFVLHISGVHEVTYMARDGHRKSIFCIQTREGLTFDMERMAPLMPTSYGRIGPGGSDIRQGILSCLPTFGVPYMVVKAAMDGGGFTVDEKSREYIDRDVDNSRIVDASDQKRNQDEYQKLEPLDFFFNPLPGVTADEQPYKDILAKVANSIITTRSTGVQTIQVNDDKSILAFEFSLRYVPQCESKHTNHTGDQHAVWETPRTCRHLTGIILSDGSKVVDTLLCGKRRTGSGVQICFKSAAYDEEHVLKSVSYNRSRYARKRVDGKHMILHRVIGVSTAFLFQREPATFKRLFGEREKSYKDRVSRFARLDDDGDVEVMVRTDQGEAVVYMHKNGIKGDWNALNSLPGTPEENQRAYSSHEGTDLAEKLHQRIKVASLGSLINQSTSHRN